MVLQSTLGATNRADKSIFPDESTSNGLGGRCKLEDDGVTFIFSITHKADGIRSKTTALNRSSA